MAEMTLKAVLFGEDRSMGKAFQGAGRDAHKAGGLIAGAGGIAKGALLGLGTAAAGAAVGGIAGLSVALVQGVRDAADYQTLSAKTAAVIKSTGNAAHQSVKGIQDRAAALESMSGVDETLIINGENVLATFTKIQDSAGKGNDIFSQATATALDMSTALGQDMQSSAIQVGKALNDPIKGVAALSKVGVSFTQQQKDQIKAMVKAGDTMGAQKLILKELNTEFGGAAKAAGQGFEGSMARAKDAVQDAFRAIGTKLLPILTKVADYVAKNAGPFIDNFSKKLGEVWDKVKPGLVKLGHWFMTTGIPALKKFAGFVVHDVVPAVQKFVGWLVRDLWPALKKGYETIMPALKQSFDIIAGAFKGTGKDGKSFGDTIRDVGKWVTTKLIPALAWVAKNVLPVLATAIRNNIEAVKIMWGVFQTLMSVVARVLSFIIGKVGDMMGMWASMLRALSKVPGFGWAKDAANKMQGAADKAHAISRAIAEIPNSKKVNILVSATAQTGRITVGGKKVNVGAFAKGTKRAPAGWKLVGEEGPELMNTAGGETILNARETARALSGSSDVASGGAGGRGSEQPLVVQFMLDGRVIQQSLLKVKRQGGVSLGLA